MTIIKNKSARLADKTRKELHKAFEQFGLKNTAESNLHVINFLDVTFDLSIGKYKPYRKPNDDPLYVNKHSNHPPCILRQLPTSINKRISTLSSDKQTFEDAAPAYQNALGHSNFSHKLEYTPHETQRPRRNRHRNVILVQPPFIKNVKTNIARSFLHLVDPHFPAGHKLHKISSRNTVKVSYSRMNNVRSIITNHNTRIIRKNKTQVISADNCNCRNKEACPLQNKCMNKDIVYRQPSAQATQRENIQRLRAIRGAHRGIASKLLKEADKILASTSTTTLDDGLKTKLNTLKQQIEGKLAKLKEVDEKILGLCDVKNIGAEVVESEEYTTKVTSCIVQLESVVNKCELQND